MSSRYSGFSHGIEVREGLWLQGTHSDYFKKNR